ncbi:MAG: bifunctional (p)ppGpp synthetase/guanosine-3',5'-bis(diphosphate) 3'-pyrophosphohydrolase [Chloroflexi bacterium]|nr:MAG: bifunctional (p)ppGpp synthetase/guanosine-3',5'-bis(diphosphate) 3'-pyrophosphohydrolase [Chloroflexota bacterium]TMC30741.1 MAG: bifunctional (p)ppGpp synthetase/guanosine-3',5'-bis(diphosphate) 3'-pyrophosphohydrolase [Chloroflexota bacterium]TMC33446.1 MAG: bifunctional (p)ppGpp synthetase/guanosine-3',5'-bis(diphosphate) 3'-pyrophosphohydrolase [Chloroflexota bacterium]TMC58928.1 MAG: bifunctional (p)ppGpp synthetase/guanosine-3',5'-bis(diphosphate) 3'-pyrophosphohydrolase [Chlorofl
MTAQRAPNPITARIVGITERLRPRTHGHIDAEAIVKEMLRHYPDGDAELVRRAYSYAAEAHEGQKRVSGEPYITHPAAVAMLIAELGMDPATVAATLLHDVPEDTPKTVDDIRQQFGDEIGRLVEGVTKLSRLQGQSRDAHQAENIRKMFLAMADDLRVVVIKLCDRLHNMRTLAPLPADKQRRIAQQTMEIYAPLAHRLGIWQIKWELEDLAFKYLEPEQYKELADQLAERRQSRERYIEQAMKNLATELEKAGVRAELSGRAKHLWSIEQKMRRKGVGFNEVYDLLAIRVIVDDLPSCYAALGVVHTLWPPVPGQFDDYIAVPKANLYQSLHTAVMGPGAQPLEIQVRTSEMHTLAEYGIAAHWRYKEGGKADANYESKLAWVRQLLEWQHDVTDSQEFVESLKVDVFQDEVFVFTPKGEVKALSAGSTPIDFAYRIHTDVGHRTIGAKVNGRIVPLDYRLQSGDIVEIVTSKAARGPSRDWLTMVQTPSAREKIRQWFKRAQRDENIAHGKELLDRELKRLAQRSLGDISDADLRRVTEVLNMHDVDTLFASLGYGALTAASVVTRLGIVDDAQQVLPEIAPMVPPTTARGGVRVKGVGDLLVRFAVCCNPVPGDPIVGYITRGRGVTVHRADCTNVKSSADTERFVEVEWEQAATRTYPVAIRIQGWDRDGFLRDVAAVISENQVQLVALSAAANPDRSATVNATLQVTSVEQLSRVLARLESVRDVFSVHRDAR